MNLREARAFAENKVKAFQSALLAELEQKGFNNQTAELQVKFTLKKKIAQANKLLFDDEWYQIEHSFQGVKSPAKDIYNEFLQAFACANGNPVTSEELKKLTSETLNRLIENKTIIGGQVLLRTNSTAAQLVLSPVSYFYKLKSNFAIRLSAQGFSLRKVIGVSTDQYIVIRKQKY